MKYTKGLFWGNIPRGNKVLSTNLGFFETSFNKKRFFNSIESPYYIWTGPSRIDPLEQIQYSPKILKKLNKTGLHIYLYEPLPVSASNNTFGRDVPSNIPYEDLRSEYLDSIKIFVNNNKLTNVKVFACDYNIRRLQKQYPEFELYCLDTFLRGIKYQCEFDKFKNIITKKFWCGNWRYTPARHIATAYLISLSGNYSWNVSCNFKTLKENSWFNLDQLELDNPVRFAQLKLGIDILEKNVFSIDQDVNTVTVDDAQGYFTPGPIPLRSDALTQSYKECFCAVVNETNFATPLAYFSEKTTSAMNAGLPFVLVAPAHTLEYVKLFGFKTFDRWWDESYDQEEDHEKRMLMVFDIIDFINSKSIEELQLIYNEMAEIIAHNKSLINSITLNRNAL